MSYLSKYIRMAAGLILLLCFATSCTNDYFEDENNCWIYVPQIKEGTIQDFYIAFHDANGVHMRTSHIFIPFDKNEKMRDGILRFKLKPGESAISCFAQTAGMGLTEGQPATESSITAPVLPNIEHLYAPSGPLRIIKDQKFVYPIGHPEAKTPQTIDISEDHVYIGTIIHEFKDLPSIITRIDITYTGLATRFEFGGLFDNITPQDRTQVSYIVDRTSRETLSYSDKYFPSSGIGLDGTEYSPVPLQLDVLFYADNKVVGHFSDEISDPTDGDGTTITGDVLLHPRQTLKFTYKGFTVTGISLVDWGDIGQGDVTPL